MSTKSEKIMSLIRLAEGEGEEARTAAHTACRMIREGKFQVTGGIEPKAKTKSDVHPAAAEQPAAAPKYRPRDTWSGEYQDFGGDPFVDAYRRAWDAAERNERGRTYGGVYGGEPPPRPSRDADFERGMNEIYDAFRKAGIKV